MVTLDPNAFMTGTVLSPGQKELELHVDDFYSAGGAGFGIGLPHGLEARSTITYNQRYSTHWDVFGLEFGLTRGIARTKPFVASFSLGLGGLVSYETLNTLIGGRASATVAAGYYPVSWLGIFTPLRLAGIATNRSHSQLSVAPGIGLAVETGRVILRVATSCLVPMPDWRAYSLGEVHYPELQIGFRW